MERENWFADTNSQFSVHNLLSDTVNWNLAMCGTGFAACAAHRRFGNAAVRAGIDGCNGCRMVRGTYRLRYNVCDNGYVKWH